VGENSQYGDFFGLDDLFKEDPVVVDGMIDIYKAWIRDFRIDGFRMDTMKHVNDEFWQKFSPAIVDYAKSQGIDDFYMFGEVAEDFSQEFISHFTTHDDVQGVLDFVFQMNAMGFAASSAPASNLKTFFENDDWYTDGDSNAYNLPTFLGNHDRGRVGMFLRNANPGAPEAELLARDKLAHALMYFSRGNPVIYYGDEQGFTGAGGDQDARQDMFPSLSPQYNNLSDPVEGDDGAGKNDNIGSDETPVDDNFDRGHVLYRELAGLASATKRHPALRDGAQQHRFASSTAGVYAFSRIDRSRKHEYVVALNNAEQPASASVPTYIADGKWEKVWGSGEQRLRTRGDKRLGVALAPLSAVVYRSQKHIPRSRQAPSVDVRVPTPSADRQKVVADVGGSSFSEVTFLAKAGNGAWKDIGTDDNAPYRVFHDTADIAPGTQVSYKAVVLDNAGHTRTSAVRTVTIPPPVITIEAPFENQGVRSSVALRATVAPEHPYYVMTFQRSTDGGATWTTVSTDDSSPVYTATDNPSALADGTVVRYRAVLDYGEGTTTSAVRTVRVVQARVTTATVHYNRSDGDYGAWGLHIFGDGLAPGQGTAEWTNPTPFEGSDAFGAFHRIGIADDEKRVGIIVHRRPPGDPNVKDTDPDRYFIPLATPEIWLREGDGRIYNCAAANDTCVVPSA